MMDRDFIIERDGTIRRDYCKRASGNYRAYFHSREDAEAFATDPANVAYHGDVAHKCLKCGAWHLSRPEWLVPEWVKDMRGKNWS